MSGIRLATRYAKGIMDLAIERNVLEDVTSDIRFVRQTIKDNRDLELLLESPIVQPSKKRTIIELIFGGNVHSMLVEFIIIMFRKRREQYLLTVCDVYLEMYNEYKHIKKVKITTAIPINEELQQQIVNSLREANVSEIELETEVNPDLLGGYVLLYGDKQYDASVLKNLSYMRSEFNKNTYVKKY